MATLPQLVLTDAQLLLDLSDEIKKVAGNLPPYWPNLVSQSHAWAVNRIISGLVSRGYSIAQIQSADQTADYERALTLFMAIKRSAVVEGNNDINLKSLDFTEGLKEAVLTTGGQFIIPAGPFGVPHGGLPNTSDDIFVWPDETNLGEDAPGPGRGQPIDW